MFGAARFHGAPAGGYDDFRDWLHAHWDAVEATALVRATQTNEAARCALHLPVLAGLDGHPRLDPADGPSPVVIDCAVGGPVPVPRALPQVVWRGGGVRRLRARARRRPVGLGAAARQGRALARAALTTRYRPWRSGRDRTVSALSDPRQRPRVHWGA